jgi:phosphoglycerol transferase MdoB-like AlkP superfamily enzyme
MYADYALGKFFESAKQMPWFSNTLFVITADHTSEGYYPYYQTDAGQYAIPILYYMAGDKIRGNGGGISQQTDIMPSVLDFLQYDHDYIAFGNSVFDTTAARFSVHYISGVFGLIKDGYLLESDGTKTTAFYDLQKDTLQKNNLRLMNPPAMKPLETFLKAYLQQYNNRLVENRLTAE